MATRIVVHSSPLDLLQAVEGYPDADGVRTNHALGFVFERQIKAVSAPVDNSGEPEGESKKPDEDVEVLATAWTGDELRLIFTKLGWAQCKIVSPVADSALSTLTIPLLTPLVSRLLTLEPFSITPALLRSIAGPQLLVDAFLALWPHPRLPDPSMLILPASIRIPPPPVSCPPGHSLARITDLSCLPASELSALARLLTDFYGDHVTAPKLSPEGAVAHFRTVVARGAFWVYRAPPPTGGAADAPAEPVGFVQTGRPTPRTVAIRGVYVAPSHRSSGVATRMTAAVVRAHLAEAPRVALERGEAEDERTRYGGKDEVCLFVEPGNPGARKAYGKIGFRETEAVWCDADLEGIEPGHW
ncbi:hypothetical protein JCM10450v2_002606 [Rhodotorula kratochvilovae]